MKIELKLLAYALGLLLYTAPAVLINTAQAAPPDRAARDTRNAAKLDLNTASQRDLEQLPGIGEVKAKKIIAARPYISVDDLSKAGITPAEIAKIRPLVSISSRVDLNTASRKQIEELPGIGSITAKKIITARPITSLDQLSKAGVSKSQIERIAPLVMIRGQEEAEPAAAPIPPQKGMVWVNTETKVYHREGGRWYGKTKHGQFMTEQQAQKDGYRPAKE